MANVENALQAKCDSVAGVTAPEIDDYPEGYVDAFELPIALTWIIDTTPDPTGMLSRSTVQIDVLVEAVGQDRFKLTKDACRALRILFLAEFLITPSNAHIQATDPVVQIVPGSVVFGGYRDLVQAPDETPFHGFQITMEIIDYSNGC